MVSRITVAALAVVAAFGTFLLAGAVDVAPQVPARDGGGGTMDMTAANVLFVTITMVLAAIVVAAVLDRFIGNGKRVWSIVAITILALSFLLVFALELKGAALVWQVSLHLVFALILIGGFWKTWPEDVPVDSNPAGV
jgi:cytochrome bd-type quinol oxidase subunit 2